jgi:hypothetical protein
MDGLAKDENGVWKMPPSAAPISIEVKRERLQALIPSNGEISLVDQFAGITDAGPSTANAKKRPREDVGSGQQSKKKKTVSIQQSLGRLLRSNDILGTGNGQRFLPANKSDESEASAQNNGHKVAETGEGCNNGRLALSPGEYSTIPRSSPEI